MGDKSRWQVKSIYGMARQLGISQSGSKDDELHNLVHNLTGKGSIAELNYAEAQRVILRLRELANGSHRQKSSSALEAVQRLDSQVAGMMTPEQQRLVFRLVYRLRELDDHEKAATIGDRVAGAIKKILEIDVNPKAMFTWITFEQGQKLIEGLKRYVRSAERRQCPSSGPLKDGELP